MKKRKHFPFILCLSAILLVTLLLASLFLSTTQTREDSINVRLSHYHLKSSLPYAIDIEMENQESYPMYYTLKIYDALTNDLANYDGYVTYDMEYVLIGEGERHVHRVLVQPVDQTRQYVVRAVSRNGRVLGENKLTVMAHE